ncbi:hypothetical protein CKAH01_01046 [Colletotrichum kahawae]|uniref:Uncharacterized protein n=1 Tax=Colletotrichum kahawae TaxID=34407 RepID=A0AAE0D538_COLKA|nr:hypothetical protein CKAH01_01046 [Colletotrichum kahawae]
MLPAERPVTPSLAALAEKDHGKIQTRRRRRSLFFLFCYSSRPKTTTPFRGTEIKGRTVKQALVTLLSDLEGDRRGEQRKESKAKDAKEEKRNGFSAQQIGFGIGNRGPPPFKHDSASDETIVKYREQMTNNAYGYTRRCLPARELRVRASLQMGGPAGQVLSSTVTGYGASWDLRPDLEASKPQVAGDMLLSCEHSQSMLFRWMPNRKRSGPVLEESEHMRVPTTGLSAEPLKPSRVAAGPAAAPSSTSSTLPTAYLPRLIKAQ